MRRIVFTAAALSLLAAVPAFAEEPSCAAQPKDSWMSIEAITQKATDLGYTVKRIKTTNNCYEIYGIDKAGTKQEVFMDPVSGAVVGRDES